MTEVGSRRRPIAWRERTSGRERYVADLVGEGVLHCGILRSTVPHGRITLLDVRPALEVPGVMAAITVDDFPKGRTYIHMGGELADRRPLADGVVRYVGEEIAAVAAETPAAVEEALRHIKLRVRRLPASLTTDEALGKRAATLHERPAPNVAVTVSKILGRAGESPSPHAVERSYRYPAVAHAPMEPHAILASWDNEKERLEVWASTQSPYFVEKELTHVLGLLPGQVVCREVAVGGGFGVKSKIAEHEAIAGMLSIRAGRPVRCVLDRREEFMSTKTRHETQTRVRLSCDGEGALDVVEADVVMENGAYNHYGPSVLKASVEYFGLIYRPRSVRARGRLVDTAKPPGGPFRGYGVTQAAFALESAMDELAESYGSDPIDFRITNANKPDSTTLSGARIGTCALASCLDAVRKAIAWDEYRSEPKPWRGIGVAAGMHGSGSYAFTGANRSEATVGVRSDGTAVVRFGSADAGTGQRTILAQIAADELGIDADDVDVVTMDGDTTPFDAGSWSSRGTHYSGHATRVAATQLAEHLRELARDKIGGDRISLQESSAIGDHGSLPIGDLVALSPLAIDDAVWMEGSYVEERVDPPDMKGPVNKSASYAFAAHAAEVEVDPSTGRVTVMRYVAAHDSGRPLNPTLVEGQVRGGVVMGMGAALGEEMIHEGGRVVNGSYLDYALPRAADLCDIEVLLVGEPDPAGPYGAKGIGEIPLHPVAPAIANAIYAATGVRITSLPITADKILSALREKEGRRKRRYRVWRRPDRWWISFMRWLYPLGLHAVLHRWGTQVARRRSMPELDRVDTPTGITEALALAERGGTLIGGGTDWLPQVTQGLSGASRLVALGGVDELTQVRYEAGGALSVGGAVTLKAVEDLASTSLPAVAQAIKTIASTQIRQVATVAGNLLQDKRCHFYRNGFDCYKRSGPTSPCYAVLGDHRFYHAAIGAHRCQAVTPSDLATVLVGLDAEVMLRSVGKTRRLKIEEFYTGPGETRLRKQEILETVWLPSTAFRRAQAFCKLARYSGDFANVAVTVSALVDSAGRWHDPRVVLGAVAPVPWRPRRTECALDGKVFDPELLDHSLNDELDRVAHPLHSVEPC